MYLLLCHDTFCLQGCIIGVHLKRNGKISQNWQSEIVKLLKLSIDLRSRGNWPNRVTRSRTRSASSD